LLFIKSILAYVVGLAPVDESIQRTFHAKGAKGLQFAGVERLGIVSNRKKLPAGVRKLQNLASKLRSFVMLDALAVPPPTPCRSCLPLIIITAHAGMFANATSSSRARPDPRVCRGIWKICRPASWTFDAEAIPPDLAAAGVVFL
jgi:hypothetical protein